MKHYKDLEANGDFPGLRLRNCANHYYHTGCLRGHISSNANNNTCLNCGYLYQELKFEKFEKSYIEWYIDFKYNGKGDNPFK